MQGLAKYFAIKRGFFLRSVGAVKAVDDVSFSMNRGQIFGLVGESGSGKTTCGYTLAGIYKPTAGEIQFEGEDISRGDKGRSKHARKSMQLVFQNPTAALNPKRTIRQSLLVPLQSHKIATNLRDRERKIDELLETVALPIKYGKKYPSALSGGEKQRVAIARALAVNPSLVILDEPTSALDVSVQGKVLVLLLSLQNDFGLSYLFITHNLSLIRNIASQTAVMYLGKIYEVGSTVELFSNPLHPYTKMLLSSIPVVSEEEEKLKPESLAPIGEIPSPVDIPSGCGFHPRCLQEMDVCSEEAPAMVDVGRGHKVRCHIHAQMKNIGVS